MTPRRRVQYVLVCEDQQHEAFGRRFLQYMGHVTHARQIRVKSSPFGKGAGDRFVLETYAKELEAGRRSHVDRTLIVIIDGDNTGVDGRLRQLDEATRRRGIGGRSPADQVAIFIPTWNIETWLAYLDGESVDEKLKNYAKLGRPRDCQPHVQKLAAMCRRRELRSPVPDSLLAACREYVRLTSSPR